MDTGWQHVASCIRRGRRRPVDSRSDLHHKIYVGFDCSRPAYSKACRPSTALRPLPRAEGFWRCLKLHKSSNRQRHWSIQCPTSLVFSRNPFVTVARPILAARIAATVWTAVVSADASGCATTAGYFEVGFSRMKENAVELEFREQFIWSSPSVTIGLGFWADEAVESVWIDSVQACPCVR